WLRNGGDSQVLNCGCGHGYSVREVVQAVERLTGEPLPVREDARRPGDPPTLVANANRIRELLGWTPQLDDLDKIVASSLAWERNMRYPPPPAPPPGRTTPSS
ncbi:MAG TPA: UDP-glucose 4-epimerase GalE, partial [Gammaproteobacteria bacterium]|nr:UDP-glucose 4-epimerase GalE [Gammaproteobacteria bacterium]